MNRKAGEGIRIKVGKRSFRSIKALSKHYKINYCTLYNRLKRMSPKKAVARRELWTRY
jgi:hypothetical protein